MRVKMDYQLQYLDSINAFHNWCYDHKLDGKSQLIFLKILYLSYINNCEEWTEISNFKLMVLSDFTNEKTFIKYRDKLIELGFIKYKKGKKGYPNKYKINYEMFRI